MVKCEKSKDYSGFIKEISRHFPRLNLKISNKRIAANNVDLLTKENTIRNTTPNAGNM
jgi:hypothetical protein